MNVTLTRVNRMVHATGPGGLPPDGPLFELLADRLTYFTQTFVRDGYSSSGYYETIARRQYVIDSHTGRLAFPLGLLPSVAGLLASTGHTVDVVGRTFAEEDPKTHRLDIDGVLADFDVRAGQDEALAQVAASDGGLITSGTGWGKTEVIRMICRMYPGARIHVVSKFTEVARTNYDRLVEKLPSVGFVGAGRRQFGRVTVFVADSLHHGEGKADIVLADECHELIAPKYAGLLGLYTRARMFGFTATPDGRHDGRDRELEAVFGPVLYTLSYSESQELGYVVPTTVEWVRVGRGPIVAGMDPVEKERIGVWQNAERNTVIARRVGRVDPSLQTLVVTATIEHAVRLKALLPDYALCYSPAGMDRDRLADYQSAGLLGPDEPVMTPRRREHLRTEFAAGRLRKVISNYVWSTGVDFPLLRVLVRADAGGRGKKNKDYQIPGRACRRVPGVKEESLVIDFWDEWDTSMITRSRGRRRNYQIHGWTQLFARPEDDPIPTGIPL